MAEECLDVLFLVDDETGLGCLSTQDARRRMTDGVAVEVVGGRCAKKTSNLKKSCTISEAMRLFCAGFQCVNNELGTTVVKVEMILLMDMGNLDG